MYIMWWKKYIKVIIILVIILSLGFGVYKLARVIVSNTYSSSEFVKEKESDKNKNSESAKSKNSDSDSVDTDDSESNSNDSVESYESSNVEEYNLNEYQKGKSSIREDGDVDNSSYTRDEYILRLASVLNTDNSPYHKFYAECNGVAEDIEGGDKLVTIMHEDEVVVSVYCNSVDYAPYMFTKTTPFTDAENTFYSSLGNGETGEDNGVYYWKYI